MSRFRKSHVALVLLVALLSACSSSGDKSSDPVSPNPPGGGGGGSHDTVRVSISPSTATVDAGGSASFTASVTGTDSRGVQWTASAGSIQPSGSTAQWTAPMAQGSYRITATSTADPSKSATATVTVPQISLSISPNTAEVGFGGSKEFTASISGVHDKSLTWSASGGTISGSGTTVTWESPLAPGDYTITARSTASPANEASAEVTVTPIHVTLATESVALARGGTHTFQAQVNGASTGYDSVSWEASCGTGTAAGAGGRNFTYTAPYSGGPCQITARSTADNSQADSATVTLSPELIVNSLDDKSDGTCDASHCSLREAMEVAAAEGDSILIRLPGVEGSGLRRKPAARAARDGGPAVIQLEDSLPRIRSNLVILGPGRDNFTIDINGSEDSQRNAFRVDSGGQLVIHGLTVTGGNHRIAGGAINVFRGDLVLEDVRLSQNRSSTSGGAIYMWGSSRGFLSNVVLEGNAASGNAGAIYITGSSLNATNLRVVNNTSGSSGGGIYASTSDLVLEDVTISDNSAGGSGGGGIALGISNNLAIVRGVIERNSAPGPGGGIVVAISIFGGFQDDLTNTLDITESVIRDNETKEQGGGIQIRGNAILNVTNSSITGNRVLDNNDRQFPVGAGIAMFSKTTASIINSTISGNVSGYNKYASWNAGGGGIFISASNGEDYPTTITVRNSTISGNESGFFGGGFYSARATVTMENTTVSGNSARNGGGIVTGSEFTLVNSTITRNTATDARGGLWNTNRGAWTSTPELTVVNTIFSDNSAKGQPVNCVLEHGTVTSAGSNISDDNTCTDLTHETDRNTTGPDIDPDLRDNGGPTRTHALRARSVAIDAGNMDFCPPADQRGVARNGRCDIGAFEYVAAGASFSALMAPARLLRRSVHGLPPTRRPRAIYNEQERAMSTSVIPGASR